MAELSPPSPPWLSAITLHGFKSFDWLERFPLEAVNVFIGANGVGKSNFISFFEFLRSIAAGELSRRVAADGGANLLLHHGAKRTPELSFDLEFLVGGNGYRLRLGVTAQDGLTPIEEVVSFWDRQKHPRPLEERLAPGPNEAAIQDAFHRGPAWWVHREILGFVGTTSTTQVPFRPSEGRPTSTTISYWPPMGRTSLPISTCCAKGTLPSIGRFCTRSDGSRPSCVTSCWIHFL